METEKEGKYSQVLVQILRNYVRISSMRSRNSPSLRGFRLFRHRAHAFHNGTLSRTLSFTSRKFCEDRNAEIAPLDLVLYLYHSHSPEVELVLFSLRWSSGEHVHSRNFTAFRAHRKKGARKGGLRGMVARLITYHNTRTGKQNRYPVRRECTTVQIALSN